MSYPALSCTVTLALLIPLQIASPSKAASYDEQNWKVFGGRAPVPSFFRRENRTVDLSLDVPSTTSNRNKFLWRRNRNLDFGSRRKRAVTGRQNYAWPNNTVPYTIERNGFDATDRGVISEAIQEWMKHTCLVFRPASSQDQRVIVFKDGDKCEFEGTPSPRGQQIIILSTGCRYKDIVMHEIGHALGFRHEHQRPDRDGYITVDRQNIKNGFTNLFQKLTSNAINTHNSPYDFKSIMHFGNKDFSKNRQATIITKNRTNRIGQAQETGHLSFWDIKVANEINNCAARCCSETCPGDGFVGKDCQCMCPGNPIRVCTGSAPRSSRQCGRANTPRGRILRGKVSDLGEWPWIAFVEFLLYEDRVALCGGTLIGENWVVTAGHCVFRRDKSSIKVYLGKHFVNNSQDDSMVQSFQVSEVHLHPEYNTSILDSDIAILRLTGCVRTTERVSPICLSSLNAAGSRETENFLRPGRELTVIGWGQTLNSIYSNILRKANIRTISNAQCRTNYEQAANITAGEKPVVVTRNMFCAAGQGGLVDSCIGDSGVPAMASVGSGAWRKWYFVGIVSKGKRGECGVPGLYGVYTRLSRFLSFIKTVTGL